jgi:hypothetical protein
MKLIFVSWSERAIVKREAQGIFNFGGTNGNKISRRFCSASDSVADSVESEPPPGAEALRAATEERYSADARYVECPKA